MAEGPLGTGAAIRRIAAADGVGLRFALRAGSGRGVVLLFQGRTEFLEKYADVADGLAARGLGVASVDWRGQGGSDRPVGHPRKGHVEDFSEFQRDATAMVAAAADHPGPRLVLAHSMGGAIGLRWLLEGGQAAGAVFSAPMWGLGGGRGLNFAGRVIGRVGCALGLGTRYAPGGGDQTYALSAPDPNVLTSDAAAADWIARVTKANEDKALGGPTVGWLRAAYREMDALAPRRLATPAVVVAGSDEQVVSLDAMRARAARDGFGMVEIPGARHEPMFETPARRAEFWDGFDRFLGTIGV